jgi:hypothetical protein
MVSAELACAEEKRRSTSGNMAILLLRPITLVKMEMG